MLRSCFWLSVFALENDADAGNGVRWCHVLARSVRAKFAFFFFFIEKRPTVVVGFQGIGVWVACIDVTLSNVDYDQM